MTDSSPQNTGSDDGTQDLDITDRILESTGPTPDDTPPDILESIPADYFELESWKRWVAAAIPWTLLAVLGIIAILALMIFPENLINGVYWLLFGLVFTLIEAFAAFMILREYKRWRLEYRSASTETGTFYKVEAQSKWFFLFGPDEPRKLDLDTAEYLPGRKTIPELYIPISAFRNSCSLTLDGPGQADAEYFRDMRHIMYSRKIADIIEFRKAQLNKQHTEDMGFQTRQALAGERTNELLERIIMILTESRDEVKNPKDPI